MVGATVVGATVVGATVVGATVVGATVVEVVVVCPAPWVLTVTVVVGATVVVVGAAVVVVGATVVVVGAAVVVVVGAAVVVVVGATVDGTSTVVVVDGGGYKGKLVTVVGGSVLVGTVELVVVVLVGSVELVVVVLVGSVELVVVVVEVVGGVAPPPGRSPSKLPFTEAAYTKPSSWPLLNVNVALGAKMLMSTPAPDIDKLVASGKLRSVLARNAST